MLLARPLPGPLLTIIVPAYNEAARLARLHHAVAQALAAAPCRWEILLVDDGSCDGTARVWRTLMARDERLGLVELSRNFGKEAALLAGFRHARGDVVVPMDADLQDPPEVIVRFLVRWRAGFDMVYGVRRSRVDPCWKRLGAQVFYASVRHLLGLDIPAQAGDFRLLDRRLVDCLCALPDTGGFTRGLYQWLGGRACAVSYDRPARGGARRYPLRHALEQSLCALSCCTWPLRGIIVVGALMAVAAGAWILIAVLCGTTSLAAGAPGSPSAGPGPTFGRTALMVPVLLLLTSLPLMGCGVLGLYLEPVVRAVLRRPGYVIARCSGSVLSGPPRATVALPCIDRRHDMRARSALAAGMRTPEPVRAGKVTTADARSGGLAMPPSP